MALTTTQVNAAYVALLGRAAEGSAANWAAGSLTEEALAQTILSIDDSFKNDVERKATNADFVDALYSELLGKAGDAEGKTFWTNALNSGLSREEVKLQFINAAKANNENLSAFYAENELFVNNVYGNLLGRGADSDGLKFWADALNNGASKASVIANIITAIQAQPASEDFKTFSAKMAVANTVSASFSGFKSGLNADQKQAALDTMKQIIQSTTADVKPTDETIKTSIDNLVGNYERESLYNFRVSEESYDLGNAESTNSQTFRGTINLIDDKKSTYTDKANVKTGKYSDSLIIDVVSNQANKTLNATNIKPVAGIDSLTINNGTADVTNLKSDGFSQNIKVTGAANVSGSVSTTLNYLEVSTGAGKTATIAVNANLKEYKATGTGKDNLTVSGGSVTKVDTGAGDDTVVVSGASSSISGATINLGSGNDKITITDDVNVSGATIDGGAGRDTLVVSGNISGSGDFTLKNVEVLEASGTAKVSYAQIKDQALTLTSTSGTGTLEINAADTAAIDLSKLNNKVVSGDATALTALTLSNVGSGATVKLNANNGIAETITLASNATGVKVSGIAKTNTVAEQDKVSLAGITGLNDVSGGGSSNVFATVNGGASGSSKTIDDKKGYYFDYSGSDDLTNTTKVAAILASAYIEGASSSGKNAVLAINKGTDSYIYKITTADASKTIASTELSLIAIVDNKVDGSDTMTTGVITFA